MTGHAKQRAPYLSQSVRRGLAKIAAGIVDPDDRDTRAAQRWAGAISALSEHERNLTKAEKLPA